MSHRNSDKFSIILNKKEDSITQIKDINHSEQSDFKDFNITEKKLFRRQPAAIPELFNYD
ncbi:hypothetical protein [Apibacter sp. ESL0404]|uniref:hypothetical protein n=1 Tax=Apibacter sp. ESL0404 TaxID=2704651 RepID=UPI001C6A1476|nr:hypothetical protein [Apibacter sp. ESL0404]QYN50689.1 hypothetical protein GYM72_03780 [Apibacter sp. ESL0404]